MNSPSATPRHALARRIVIDLTVMTGIGVFLALSGAFGSMALPLPVRLMNWIGFAWLGYAFFRPMESVVSWAQRTLDLPRSGLWIAGCLIASVPMTMAVLALGRLPPAPIWPGLEVAMGTYSSVLVVGGAATLLFNLVKPGQRAPEPVPVLMPHPAAMPASMPGAVPLAPTLAVPPPNPLLDRLPPELGSDIIALEMEDHYVRVHTAIGSALVLMRLRDAMVLVAETEGMQVHRSWWVARGAVEDVLRDGRNIRLRLSRGLVAPVARANVASLREARWI